jgi:hypothetical protein
VRREGVLQVIFRHVETKVPYKQFCTHLFFTVLTHFYFSRLFPPAGFQIITEPSSPEDPPCHGSHK